MQIINKYRSKGGKKVKKNGGMMRCGAKLGSRSIPRPQGEGGKKGKNRTGTHFSSSDTPRKAREVNEEGTGKCQTIDGWGEVHFLRSEGAGKSQFTLAKTQGSSERVGKEAGRKGTEMGKRGKKKPVLMGRIVEANLRKKWKGTQKKERRTCERK